MNRCHLLIDTVLDGVGMSIVSTRTGEIVWLQYCDQTEALGSVGIAKLFHEAQAWIQNSGTKIENTYVGNGPGSFTGIKIGLAFGKGLQQGLKDQPEHLRKTKNIYGISWARWTADFFFRQDPDFFALVLPASLQRGAILKWNVEEKKIDAADFTISQLTDEVATRREKVIYSTRPWPMLESALMTMENQRFLVKIISSRQAFEAGIQCFGAWCATKSDELQHPTIGSLEPDYLRVSAAEEKRA